LLVVSFVCLSCIEFFPEYPSHPGRRFTHNYRPLRPSDSTSLHFFVLSDWGFNGSGNQKKVASQMSQTAENVRLDFILTCGDNFQYEGVESKDDPLWAANFENVYNESSLQVPWYPALGNHDYRGNPEAEVEYSAISKTWNMPARYYTFVKMVDARISARFIVLDTPGLLEECQYPDYFRKPQYSWLKEVLSRTREQWIVVTGHHPVYSASFFHGDTKEMKELIKPLFDYYQVDFYICGHDHDFEHARARREYTDYIVTGTGGDTRNNRHNLRTQFSLSELGFTFFSISHDRAELWFITSEGEIGYHYIKMK
jgi:tartrate-resistant acid phosphatase type 5